MTTHTTPPGVLQPAALTTTFGGLTIAYDDRVLEPRPWTADQSRWAADLIAEAPPGPVLELCSGAGHIGLLAVSLAPRPLVCVDASEVACAYARSNARAAGLSELVEVRAARLEQGVDEEERFAVVIADPPWVPSAETEHFPEDPLTAIDGGGDGLDVARACLEVAGRHLLPGGQVVLQLGTRAQAWTLDCERRGGLVLRELRDGERGVLVRLVAG